MKMAVAHFQCAAWAFHALPDKFPQESDSDLSSEVLAFKSGLCLAQVTFETIIPLHNMYLSTIDLMIGTKTDLTC